MSWYDDGRSDSTSSSSSSSRSSGGSGGGSGNNGRASGASGTGDNATGNNGRNNGNRGNASKSDRGYLEKCLSENGRENDTRRKRSTVAAEEEGLGPIVRRTARAKA